MPVSGFCWYELLTTDVDAATAFYSGLLGWTTEEASTPSGGRYVVATAPSGGVAGIMDLPSDYSEAGGRPAWDGYVGVADVDAATAAFVRDGGSVKRRPADIPGVGRFSVVADPQCGVLTLFSPHAAEGQSQSAFGMAPGQCGWNEYFPDDIDRAMDFFGRHFGWTKADAVDMGPEMGPYQMFRAEDPAPHGGMMKRVPQIPVPVWQFYFNVEACDAAVVRATATGGTLLMGPMEVPGGMWVANFTDPQGAHFGIVAPRR